MREPKFTAVISNWYGNKKETIWNDLILILVTAILMALIFVPFIKYKQNGNTDWLWWYSYIPVAMLWMIIKGIIDWYRKEKNKLKKKLDEEDEQHI